MFGGIQQLVQQFAGRADAGTAAQVPHQEAYQAYDTMQQHMTPEQIGQAAQRYYEQASLEQRAQMGPAVSAGLRQV